MKAHRLGSFLLAFLLLSLFLVSATGCGGMTVQAHDLMEDIIPVSYTHLRAHETL